MAFQKIQVFQDFMEKIETELEDKDLSKLVQVFLKSRVIYKEVKKRFDSLDNDSVDTDIKVRYLIQNIYEMFENDNSVYDRFTRTLSKLGGSAKVLCDEMSKDLGKGEGNYTVSLTDKDVPILTEVLVSGSHKWEEIAVAAGLPEYVRDDCGKGSSNPIRLSNVLTAWIKGGYGGSCPPTLHSLSSVLSGKIVGLPRLAMSLSTLSVLADSKNPTSSCNDPEIIFSSIDTEVTEGRSTLLEVQVSSSMPVIYEWMKDGRAISDTTRYSGISSAILYVAPASIQAQGTYSCSITCGTTSLTSEEFELTVKLPKEKELLCEAYLSASESVSKECWPPVSSKKFHTLILHSREDDKEQYATIREGIDKVVEKKLKVNYKEVFSVAEKGSLTIVEGRPGSGKTTLVHKLVIDWATGELILQNMKLVFLVTLRTLNDSDVLKDWLTLYYSDAEFCSTIAKSIEECNGMDIAFILDGLDECNFMNNEQNFIYKLLHKMYLPSSTVIVTSRPVVLTRNLKRYSKRNIEVIGFNKEDIFDYINNCPFQSMNCGTVASDLIAYVQTHVNVLHMCYLPLHAAIICFLFSEFKGKIPNTETQLYEQFIIATILRKLKRDKQSAVQITSLQDIEGSLRKNFLQVCSLAFGMTINSYQVISKKNTSVSLPADLNSDEFSLGLLTVQQTSKLYGTEDLYAFHHLSMQEYLAAYHIAELSEYEQDLVLSEYAEHENLQNMWKFFFGIVKFTCNLNKFSKLLLASESSCSNVMRYAFESQQTNVCSYTVECNNEMFSFGMVTITYSDFFALNYIMSTSLCHVSKMKFLKSKFDKNSVECLKCDALKHVKECIFSGYHNDSEDYEVLNALLSKFLFVEVLDIMNDDLSEIAISTITKNVTLPHLRVLKIGLSYLRYDSLQHLKFGSKVIEQVYVHIPSVSLRKLSMIKNAICQSFELQVYSGSSFPSLYLYNSPEKLPYLCYDSLQTCVEIALVNCGVNDDLTKLLGAGFRDSSCLLSIELDFNEITDCGALCLADSIATLKQIAVVSLQCNCIGDLGAIALAKSVAQNHNLKRLDFQGNLLTDEGAIAVAIAASQVPHLELYLCNVNITSAGLKKILECNKNALVEEALIYNSFSWKAITKNGQDTILNALKCGKCPVLAISESQSLWENLNECCSLNECCKNVKVLRIIGRKSSLRFSLNISNILKGTTTKVEKIFISLFKDVNRRMYCITKKLHTRYESCVNILSAIPTVKAGGTLHTLCLSHNMIDSKHLVEIFLLLKDSKHLKSLDLSHNLITSIDLIDLCKLSRELTQLNLSNNFIVFNGSPDEILDMAIQELDVSNNDLYSCILLLNAFLVHCGDLVHLNLSDNCLGLRIFDLIEGMTSSGTLETLALGSNHIESEHVAALVEIVINNSDLKTVDFSQNCIAADGAKILSEALAKGKNITSLNLSENHLSAEGLSCLLDSLKCCSNLNSLNLSQTGLDETGISVLDDFQCGTNLYQLDLSGNSLNPKPFGIEAWKDYEALPEELISSFAFDSLIGCQFLANALTFCLKLKNLCLANMNIDRNGVELIASSLEFCQALEHLDMSNNPLLTSEGAAILVEKLQRPRNLTLDLTSSILSNCKTALLNGENCCRSCMRILLVYYANDSLFLWLNSSGNRSIPKLLSKTELK